MLNRIAGGVLRNVVRKSEMTSTRSLYPYSRSMVVRIKTPDEMKTAEKLFWSGVTIAVIMSVPAYVMLNLKSYKGE
jgi:hypothetical protein